MTTITYIGHATMLIETKGGVVLTDPVFSRRVLFFKRRTKLNFDPTKLPDLSAVVITHAHYDHLDFSSFKYISGSVPVFVPDGLGHFVGKFIRNPVIELKRWATHTLSSGLEVTATYAQHVGFRWSGLRYKGCNGYIINKNIFFAGDTAYGPHFKEMGKTYKINVAILPIGGYAPRFFMKDRHMDPSEALDAFIDLGAQHMVPFHYGTFKLSCELLGEPIERLKKLVSERNFYSRVHIVEAGAKIDLTA